MAKDADLFWTVMADVKPLKEQRSRRVASRPKPATGSKPQARLSAAVTKTARFVRTSPSISDFSFDRDVDRALARGRRSPEATLDLHGLTLAAAERAVSRFLEEAAALQLRIVLIVTGKGLRQEGGRVVGGRIRAEFPGWLQRADNRGRVRGMKPAHPRHGGGGAFYVLLRRR